MPGRNLEKEGGEEKRWKESTMKGGETDEEEAGEAAVAGVCTCQYGRSVWVRLVFVGMWS